MKKCMSLAVPAIAASLYGQSVNAGDLYTATPVFATPPGVVYNSGAYVGLGIGGQFDNQNIQALTSPLITDLTKAVGNTAFKGNVYGGYDYVWSSTLPAVIGAWAEGNLYSGDMNVMGLKVAAKNGFAVGGRLGYYIGPVFMPYITGGYTQSNYSVNTTGSNLDNLSGATLGFGAELALFQNIWLKAEYRHDWYNNARLAAATEIMPELKDQLDANQVLLGIHYKFGGPVVPLSVKDNYAPYK
jgi:outer membrane immunogenic protein